MISSATTTVSILRGSSVDEWGDAMDNDTVVASGISASIIERHTEPFSEVTGNPKVLRKATLRIGSEHDLRTNDRIHDERNNETWVILEISKVQNPVCAMDTKALLHRTT
ncbi:hypothetical protein OG264_11705 [Streptomyces xanthophaeus]|uniref:hypothetical protein n=1 Tax=Streptomyces xanthophaeus TaxID=67385 RepID=UPI00386F7CAD|nr:hypothetical protein OG264_11705 [Streptomyces xanthophaeus]